ncbi:MAG: xanthine dehydrogenase family protein subunit M, partial [Aldersonia sp.]|nr:xanthine dehydrogenase family protein subunit M [Aldersonia sp.]
MIPSTFDYVAPTSLDEAVSSLANAGEDAKIIAGGQSLMPVLRLRMAAPTTLVDLGKIAELRGVREDGDSLVIGAMATHHDVMNDPLIGQHAALLAEATKTVADPQIRHRGTFGGSLAHADPAGDLGGAVLALDATLTVVGPNGQRSIEADGFFTDYFETALEPDEILVYVRIPKHTGWRAHYEKFHRVSQSWSMVGVAATLDVDGGTIRRAGVALTNMAAVPVRARGVEQALI